MEREPIKVTRQDRIYCLKASSDYHSEVCEECKFYSGCDHMTQDDITELTIKDLEALEQKPCEDWHDVPSDEMTLEQAQQGVKDLRKKLAEYLEQEPCEDAISRQAAIDEIEYELEMINSALDSMTLDFNARERLRQRRGEAREILNSIQQLPHVTPQPKIGRWIDEGFYAEGHSEHAYRCSECNEHYIGYVGEFKHCPNCGAIMKGEADGK